ncbi:hypothetical protein [Streptomyces flaveus]|uniref:hypothetical protein n=1 Tax=Streptomyces flaveus TaxID=66370 RepID=UPI0033349B55
MKRMLLARYDIALGYLIIVVCAAVGLGIAWGMWPALAFVSVTIGLPITAHYGFVVGRLRVRRAHRRSRGEHVPLARVHACHVPQGDAQSAGVVCPGLRFSKDVFVVRATREVSLWQRAGRQYARIASVPTENVDVLNDDPDGLAYNREWLALRDGATRRRGLLYIKIDRKAIFLRIRG